MGANQSQRAYPRSGSINSYGESADLSENDDTEGGFVPREGYQNLEGSVGDDRDTGIAPKSMQRSRTKSLMELSSRSTLKVVNVPAEDEWSLEMDPMIIRLNQIPMAFKILEEQGGGLFQRRATYSLGLTRPLNSKPLARIGSVYSEHIKKNALEVSQKQLEINKRIKETNNEVNRLLKCYLKYQTSFANSAKKLEQVNSISKALTKCQGTLEIVLNTVELLNDMLPEEEKLEPFTWTETVADNQGSVVV